MRIAKAMMTIIVFGTALLIIPLGGTLATSTTTSSGFARPPIFAGSDCTTSATRARRSSLPKGSNHGP